MHSYSQFRRQMGIWCSLVAQHPEEDNLNVPRIYTIYQQVTLATGKQIYQ
jgi:hypothetical protein